jgi:hypothetical protein
MALNQDNEQRPEDVRIAELYREAAGEAPPEHLDRLIRERARQPEQSSTPARQRSWWPSWRAPLVAAAIAVLSATLVITMTEEGGERITLSPAKSEPEAQERSAGSAEDELRLRSQGPIESERVAKRLEDPVPKAKQSVAPSPQRAPSAPKPTPTEAHRPEAASADARVLSGQRAKPAAVRDQSEASTVGERDASVAAAPTSAVPPTPLASRPLSAGEAPEPTTGAAAAKPARPDNALASRRTETARAAPKSSSPAAALIAELEGEPPSRWVEHILTLRRDGRRQDADAVLAEFKLRYPSEPLPTSLQRNDE